MSTPSVETLLEIANEAVLRAADLLVDKHHAVFGAHATDRLEVGTKSSPIDLVTEADRLAQDAIISAIQDHFPDHRFIAEEEGADDLGNPDSPYEWIIDPLDGTTNFVHGKENFGTIVTVQKNGTFQAGVMYMPLLKKLYQGALGKGATINGRKVSLRQTKGMHDAILSSNILRRAEEGKDGAWYASMPFCASMENYGCAIQELGEILLGQNDGAFFRGIRLWDIAAGFLMMEEAGGKYRYEFLEPKNKRSGLLAVASTAPIFDELCSFVFEKNLT
ncbi:MAG TPA: inositol monophosphatase [Candidatus Peribacteraceae bacterium]|nr:inositol monophosphatase [Candidatus Peribacteraceae bacterium]